MEISYIHHSYKGLMREINKDAVEILDYENYILFIVFDGISSSKNANSAVELIKNYIKVNITNFFNDNNLEVKRMMFEANKLLINSEIKDGATTYALIFVNKKIANKTCVISNLGDTRIYLVDKQYLKQLTTDHILIHNKNIVTKYLGMVEYSYTDFNESIIDIPTETRLLICSDGFYSFIEKNPIKIHQALNLKKLGNIKRSLDKSINLQNQDDASYIFIDIKYV